MRVPVDVELGDRRDVARPHGAAHEHDLAEPGDDPRLLDEGEGDVGQRPQGGDGHGFVGAVNVGDQRIDRVLTRQRHRRHRQLGALQAVGAVHGHAGAADKLANAPRVGRRQFERHIARHRGDGTHVELGRSEGQE